MGVQEPRGRPAPTHSLRHPHLEGLPDAVQLGKEILVTVAAEELCPREGEGKDCINVSSPGIRDPNKNAPLKKYPSLCLGESNNCVPFVELHGGPQHPYYGC